MLLNYADLKYVDIKKFFKKRILKLRGAFGYIY